MIRIEQEHDIEVLRQTALLLDSENRHLLDRLQYLSERVSRLEGHGPEQRALELELELLKESLARRERALFAAKSEKRPRANGASSSFEPLPQRGHGPTAQPELPIEEVIHELPEGAERTCTVCQGSLEEMGEQTEDSEEVTVIERRFVVVRHRRKKYRCRCNANVVTAAGPRKLSPGHRYSVEFAVEVATSKYLDHLPLERQCRAMKREGLRVTNQTLWDQINVLAHHLEPTYEALSARVLSSPLVHADETRWQVVERKGSKRWWTWAVACRDAVAYRTLDSRSKEAASLVLEDYDGIVMADGYRAYSAQNRDGPEGGGPRYTLVHCWAHVRRKFVECEENWPEECKEIIGLIGELYKVEALVPTTLGAEESAKTLRFRGELREERSKALIGQIRDWAFETKPRMLPQSGLGRGITYMLGLWKGLTRFLDDARIPLDNNVIERALRGVALGRKNHYGSRSKRGTEVAAIFYSLFESAKLTGVEPKAYLLKAAIAAIDEPGTATLPHTLRD